MRKLTIALGLAMAASPVAAMASPGQGQEVYEASVEKGEIGFEVRYDGQTGGPDGGQNVGQLETTWSPVDWARLSIQGQWDRDVGGPRKTSEVTLSAVTVLGHAGGLAFATYEGYSIGANGNPDALSGKFIVEHRKGRFDLRFNLNLEKEMVSGAPVELGYAAGFDVEAAPGVRLGAQAFGDLGTFDHLFAPGEHVIGPVANFSLEKLKPGLGFELGYLFAVGKARDNYNGQVRAAIELGF